MFKPIRSLMVIEIYSDPGSSIIRPGNMNPEAKGQTFIIKQMGRGLRQEDGTFDKFGLEVGDRVAILGKIFNIPDGTTEHLVARITDVLLVEKIKEIEKVEIPSSI